MIKICYFNLFLFVILCSPADTKECVMKEAEWAVNITDSVPRWLKGKVVKKSTELFRYRTSRVSYCYEPNKSEVKVINDGYVALFTQDEFRTFFAAKELKYPLGNHYGYYGYRGAGDDSEDIFFQQDLFKVYIGGNCIVENGNVSCNSTRSNTSEYLVGQYVISGERIRAVADHLINERKNKRIKISNPLSYVLHRCGPQQLCTEGGLIYHFIKP